ncbi:MULTISPECIES: hypothetical protein [Methylobacteriaceae]|uniref:hypothetical protein n=1 Tax=Methylobacteriaceae TaxID=119045 RepID=UPI000762D844|nr:MULTISPECIES: hypothetical protein [Methylobacteriaceae]TFZ58360.1 hypothetical protein E4V01_11535 [Methylorubrum sp. Q1]
MAGRADAFEGIEPWRTLPQTLRGTQHVPLPAGDTAAAPADTLKALYPALAACWKAPEGLSRFERAEITARLSLRRDGSVIGTPQITFAKTPFANTPGDARARDILIRATLDAIARCTPVRLTPALGGAIAGRPLALRFIYDGPRGQGI